MLGLRHKISLGFSGLLIIILVIGIQGILNLSRLGDSIDVILKENYRSVIACQQMKEALERIDSGLLFTLLGDGHQGDELILNNGGVFEKALQVELNNITLPGEGEKAAHIKDLYGRYAAALDKVKDSTEPAPARRQAYFANLLPMFGQIKATADDILQMNQQNMNDANDQARKNASPARATDVSSPGPGDARGRDASSFFARSWILRPVQRLIRSADEIRRGNLDLVGARRFARRNRPPGGILQRDDGQPPGIPAHGPGQAPPRPTGDAAGLRPAEDASPWLDLDGKVEVSTESGQDGLRPPAGLLDRRPAPYGVVRTLRRGPAGKAAPSPKGATESYPAVRWRRRTLLPAGGRAHPERRRTADGHRPRSLGRHPAAAPGRDEDATSSGPSHIS